MVTVTGRALGSKKPLFDDFSVDVPTDGGAGGERTTLRDILERVVRHEVAAFRKRQRDNRFHRALTERDIAEGAEKGKVDSGGREFKAKRVDPDAAVAAALQAFEDGLYLVAIDGQECKRLDEEVALGAESRIAFIRLTLLSGG
ncbi:MAG TPA: hypothetical protein VHR72_09750 [Gemmataceae bacterium]|nr:hypothetical protein [Gemmataceae bacterium]